MRRDLGSVPPYLARSVSAGCLALSGGRVVSLGPRPAFLPPTWRIRVHRLISTLPQQ